ncbi:flavin reductase family protein [Jatrophihabitans sp. YIM 134969]
MEPLDDPLDQASLRCAFGTFPTGVMALAALRDGVPVGMAASSFTSVSLDPPLAAVCVAKTSATWPVLARLERIGLSVLAASHDVVCRQLAARGSDRFAGVGWETTPSGAVFLHGAALWLECSVASTTPAGDHHIVVVAIESLRSDPDVAPLVFHRSGFTRLQDSSAGAS